PRLPWEALRILTFGHIWPSIQVLPGCKRDSSQQGLPTAEPALLPETHTARVRSTTQTWISSKTPVSVRKVDTTSRSPRKHITSSITGRSTFVVSDPARDRLSSLSQHSS